MGNQALIDEHCRSGHHEAVKLDDAQWASLTLNGCSMGLEFRTCACGSTIAREVTP